MPWGSSLWGVNGFLLKYVKWEIKLSMYCCIPVWIVYWKPSNFSFVVTYLPLVLTRNTFYCFAAIQSNFLKLKESTHIAINSLPFHNIYCEHCLVFLLSLWLFSLKESWKKNKVISGQCVGIVLVAVRA